MRMVQEATERDRQYLSLAISLTVATILWLLGAAIFMVAERRGQNWSYFSSLYFTYVCLLTIGYGVPALTILISDLSETFIRWFSQAALKVGRATKLTSGRKFLARVRKHSKSKDGTTKARQLDGTNKNEPIDGDEHHRQLMRHVANRLADHVGSDELQEALDAESAGDELGRDIHFYHYVLSRECRKLQKNLMSCPNKQYSWHDWEYYLRLAGSVDHDIILPITLDRPLAISSSNMPNSSPAEEPSLPLSKSTPRLATQRDGAVDRATERNNRLKWKQHHRLRRVFTRHPSSSASPPQERTISDPEHLQLSRPQHQRQPTDLDLQDWSWLSDRSPLASARSETQWILKQLSRALVKDLNATRKGVRNVPPVGMRDVDWSGETKEKDGMNGVGVQRLVPRDGDTA
nr:outward-rectifier potassium channel tok1 [Quercus suber]